MAEKHIGVVTGLAIRTAKRGPMAVRERAEAIEDGGIEGDVKSSLERGVTLLSARQWDEVVDQMGVDLPWHTRRANVLIDGGGLGHLIGQTVSLGTVRLQIINETAPCWLMDELHAGLREALSPDCRGGVYGRVLAGGQLAVGDAVAIVS